MALPLQTSATWSNLQNGLCYLDHFDQSTNNASMECQGSKGETESVSGRNAPERVRHQTTFHLMALVTDRAARSLEELDPTHST